MIILFGRGILGTAVYNFFNKMGADVYRVTRDVVDFASITPIELRQFLEAVGKPGSYVINTAAYTDVSHAEQNHIKCFRINAITVDALSTACTLLNYRFMHISTNFVFDGQKSTPYNENDDPRPVNTYGLSKWLAERFILASSKDAIILRTGYLYDESRGLIPAMLKSMLDKEHFCAIHDQQIAPTSATELTKQMWLLYRHQEMPGGIYHANCQGSTTPYDLAWKLARRYNLKTQVEKIDLETFYQGSALRPVMGLLDNAKLRAFNLDIMAHWEDAFNTMVL